MGSASPIISKGVSESLAGRVSFIDLGGFTCTEVGWDRLEELWFKGAFPPSFLRQDNEQSFEWRLNYISTFLH